MQAEPAPTHGQVLATRAAAQVGLGGATLSVVLVVAALVPDWAGWSAAALCATVAGVAAARWRRWTEDPIVSAASAFVRATRRRR